METCCVDNCKGCLELIMWIDKPELFIAGRDEILFLFSAQFTTATWLIEWQPADCTAGTTLDIYPLFLRAVKSVVIYAKSAEPSAEMQFSARRLISQVITDQMTNDKRAAFG